RRSKSTCSKGENPVREETGLGPIQISDVSCQMPAPVSSDRIRVDGKFFRLGEEKFYARGVAYGPFALSAENDYFPSRELARSDFQLIRELGANVVRTYYPPPRWMLDLANEYELKLLVDIPWEKNSCFLDSVKMKEAAREA